jgi:hypothetical protein
VITLKEFDIHHGLPSVEVALQSLEMFIKLSKNNSSVIKIIHGYGSTGKGGLIKIACRAEIEKKYRQGIVKAYIPGEAISTPMGFDETIRLYQKLIQTDSDYRKGNDGITYVFFK